MDWENAARAAARLAKQVELALDAVDLSMPQYRVMVFLSEGAAGASTLAGTLAVSRPTITVVVDGLVAKGYVERQGDENDRRKVHHRLTPRAGVPSSVPTASCPNGSPSSPRTSTARRRPLR